MPDNKMPSATGVRIAGDNYQWLHAWRMCLQALHEDATGNTSNPVLAIGVEEPGVGNGDDVVAHRAQAPNTYMQVKYAVDNRQPVNLGYLDEQKILSKMVATHKALTAGGTPVQMRLVTNRIIDPADVLLRDRDGRDNRLLPRAAEGGPKSERGKARALWASAAGKDENEATLLRFLADFYLDVGYDLDRLRAHVSLLMTANGLRSDDGAVTLGADWVSERVIAGQRRLPIEDIKQAVSNRGLQAGSPWTTVSIATIKRDELSHQADVSIDWVDHISGEQEWKRVTPKSPATWQDLASEIRTIPGLLQGRRRVLITGHMRQATGFLVGAELRRVRRYEVGIRQGEQLWTGGEQTPKYEIGSATTDLSQGPDTALIINVAATGTDAVLKWISREGLPIGQAFALTPRSGTGPNAVRSPSEANSLAIAIRDFARQHCTTSEVHLFLIGPLGLAVLLGHHWNRVSRTHIYEHLGTPDYEHAFSVDS